ncbi:hypothetical protein SEVIR_6G073875v4 [Setaria viridis]
MTAYTLEDNVLSLRKWAEMILQIAVVLYAIWNYVYRSHSWDLLAASAIMLVAGGARYVERTRALWRANLDNMQDASKKLELEEGSGWSRSTDAVVGSTITRIQGRRNRELKDDEALLLAQDLFHIWRHALVTHPSTPDHLASAPAFSLGWESMCKVVEMEVSLMYDVLYTKATVAHTWAGYLIRLLSPLATAAAASLFWFHCNSNNHGRRIRGSFIGRDHLARDGRRLRPRRGVAAESPRLDLDVRLPEEGGMGLVAAPCAVRWEMAPAPPRRRLP